MAPRPPWAQQSEIWNSSSEANDDRKLLGLRTLDQANGGKTNQLLTNAERRIALEIYETYRGGPYPMLEAYAYEQFISPSAENNIIESNQIGSCTGQVFNRDHALNNCFSISSQNAGFQTRTFLLCVYDEQAPPPFLLPLRPPPSPLTILPHHSAGNLLPQPVEPAQNPFDNTDPSDLHHDTSALSNRHLVSEDSFVLVEGIQVQTSHRRRGIGRALLNMLLAEASAILPSIRLATSWLCASDNDLDDLLRPPPSTTTSGGASRSGGSSSDSDAGGRSPRRRRSGLGQKRAEAFHRAAGFRRLGLTRFWAKSLE